MPYLSSPTAIITTTLASRQKPTTTTSDSQTPPLLHSQIAVAPTSPTLNASLPEPKPTPAHIRVKNRRKRYLDTHPAYFSSALELQDPLLYDRLIRVFQTPAEREAEGRKKGFSGVLEADLCRAEAKMEAVERSRARMAGEPLSMSSSTKPGEGSGQLQDQRGQDRISTEEVFLFDSPPSTQEEGISRWKTEMGIRFIRGEDPDFDYKSVDEAEEYDDWDEEDRDSLDRYLELVEPEFLVGDGEVLQGETGIQDY